LKFIDRLANYKLSSVFFILAVLCSATIWLCIFQVLVLPGVVLTVTSYGCLICLVLNWFYSGKRKEKVEGGKMRRSLLILLAAAVIVIFVLLALVKVIVVGVEFLVVAVLIAIALLVLYFVTKKKETEVDSGTRAGTNRRYFR
jgi:peptidoglycan biosynthesis protein MviN/MurJ (putative lipid II flippase)